MGSGGVAIAALPTVICLKVPFSDGLGGYYCFVNVTRPPSSSLSSLEQLTTVNPIKRITYKDKSFVFIIWCT